MKQGKFFLRHKRTGMYFREKGYNDLGETWIHWSTVTREAMAFPTKKHAEAMRRRLKAAGQEVWVMMT